MKERHCVPPTKCDWLMLSAKEGNVCSRNINTLFLILILQGSHFKLITAEVYSFGLIAMEGSPAHFDDLVH